MSLFSLYEKLYSAAVAPIRARKKAVKALIIVEKTLVGVSMAAYAAVVFYALFGLDFEWKNALCALVFPAACLVLVSVLRKLFRRKRPYEKGIVPLVEKPATGNSFPSRHTACAFVIATVVAAYFPLGGGILYGVGLGIACLRFLFGHHYPTDLLGGILLGVLLGLPTFFLI